MSRSVCLSMIVKNEAHVIERCLRSVRPFIDHWVVVDTGSTDDTKKRVEAAMAGMPGTLVSRPWVDFAHNRNEALELARPKADYVFVIDADDELVLPKGYERPPLSHDAYHLLIQYGTMSYWRAQLFKSEAPWRWMGVVHEYTECARPANQSRLEGPTIVIHKEGARSQDTERYLKDARLLETALEKNPNDARSAFYLGQSYRDAGKPQEALAAYERRATMGGWDEETFYALYQCAVLMERLDKPRHDVWAAYLRAFQYRPSRAEPLCELARYCRLGKEYALTYLMGKQAAEITRSGDALFVADDVYTWRSLDEYALGAYYTGRYAEAAAAWARLLTEGKLPSSERERIERNMGYITGMK